MAAPKKQRRRLTWRMIMAVLVAKNACQQARSRIRRLARAGHSPSDVYESWDHRIDLVWFISNLGFDHIYEFTGSEAWWRAVGASRRTLSLEVGDAERGSRAHRSAMYRHNKRMLDRIRRRYPWSRIQASLLRAHDRIRAL